MQTIERRQHPRYEVSGLTGKLYLFTDAQAIDVNLLGAAVRLSQRVQIGQRYRLRLQSEEGALVLETRAVRCTLKRSHPESLYEAGFEFENLLDERAQLVLGFLAGNVRIRPGQRLIERLRLVPGAGIGVEMAHDFEVKNLSLTGLRGETEAPLDTGLEPQDVVCVLPLGGTDLETPVGIVASASGEASQALRLRFTRLSRPARGALSDYLNRSTASRSHQAAASAMPAS
jgi:hypothetical protein